MSRMPPDSLAKHAARAADRAARVSAAILGSSAIHEAAHAVIAVVLGVRVQKVKTLRPAGLLRIFEDLGNDDEDDDELAYVQCESELATYRRRVRRGRPKAIALQQVLLAKCIVLMAGCEAERRLLRRGLRFGGGMRLRKMIHAGGETDRADIRALLSRMPNKRGRRERLQRWAAYLVRRHQATIKAVAKLLFFNGKLKGDAEIRRLLQKEQNPPC
jgi:hypothetical protein